MFLSVFSKSGLKECFSLFRFRPQSSFGTVQYFKPGFVKYFFISIAERQLVSRDNNLVFGRIGQGKIQLDFRYLLRFSFTSSFSRRFSGCLFYY